MDAVTVVCDRCGRPGWSLEVGEASGQVIVSGARVAGGDSEPWLVRFLAGPQAHRYRAAPGARAGAFILPAEGPATPYGGRDKLVCIGRKHPRYERVVTSASAERAYRQALAAGRTSIGLREIA